MKFYRLLKLLSLLILPLGVYAQGSKSVEMADVFREDGKIYVVVLGLVIILTGVVLFLIRVDRKLFGLEKRMRNR
jgi:CcmD family protein